MLKQHVWVSGEYFVRTVVIKINSVCCVMPDSSWCATHGVLFCSMHDTQLFPCTLSSPGYLVVHIQWLRNSWRHGGTFDVPQHTCMYYVLGKHLKCCICVTFGGFFSTFWLISVCCVIPNSFRCVTLGISSSMHGTRLFSCTPSSKGYLIAHIWS